MLCCRYTAKLVLFLHRMCLTYTLVNIIDSYSVILQNWYSSYKVIVESGKVSNQSTLPVLLTNTLFE